MKAKIYLYITFLLTLIIINSCDDGDDAVPQAAATFTSSLTTAKVGENVQFTNTSENATAFRWSFGDGTTSKEISPMKAYTNSGVYTVSLLSSGEGGATISSMDITVVPSAVFTVESEDDLIALTAVQFTNLSQGATSYLWSFGNAAASTSTEASPAFTYLTDGTYTVSLSATASTGTTTVTKQIVVKAATPEVYFIDTSDELIQKLRLDGTGTVSEFLDVAGKAGPGIAYDEVHGKIYFSDFNALGEGKIWRINLDGTELEAIATGLDDPYAIALDVAGGKVYWGEDSENGDDGHIRRANLDGTGQETIVTKFDASFYGISLDVENGKMYYYDYWNENIHVANLDGTNEETVIPGVYGFGLYVDTVNDKIYFDDQDSELLQRADIDGDNIITIDDNGSRIYGILVDHENDKLIWSGRDSGEINTSDLDGSNKEPLKTGLSSVRGIFLRN